MFNAINESSRCIVLSGGDIDGNRIFPAQSKFISTIPGLVAMVTRALPLEGESISQIELLIHELQSQELEQRYQACKGLREQAELPPEAVEALRTATKDPEPLVSAAAYLALWDHHYRDSTEEIISDLVEIRYPPYTFREIGKGLVLSAVIIILTIPIVNIILDDRLNDLWFISIPAILLAGYISYISFEDDRQRWLLAVLSSMAVGMLSGIIIYLLLSGLFMLAVSSYRGY